MIIKHPSKYRPIICLPYDVENPNHIDKKRNVLSVHTS